MTGAADAVRVPADDAGGEGDAAGPLLEATDLSVAYDGERVLEGTGIEIVPGETTAVIGPSGVGKTTLLRLLSLAIPPESGTVRLDGTDAWAVDEEARTALRRRIGFVFQEASLFDGAVGRNVAYGLRVRRSWRDRLREWARGLVGSRARPPAVRDALEVVGMDGREDEPVDTLSGGEAQRVAFARAIAYDPDVLLLDEPTSDLDPRNTAVIEDAIAEAADRGIGVCVATHDMHQARRVADRVAVLLDGGVAEVGPTEAVFEDPADPRTAQFISGELVY